MSDGNQPNDNEAEPDALAGDHYGMDDSDDDTLVSDLPEAIREGRLPAFAAAAGFSSQPAPEPSETSPEVDEPAAGTYEEDSETHQPIPALYLAQFDTPDALAHAAASLRDAGYRKWDCHTPYPVHGLDEAMGLRPTKIGWIAFCAGMVGLVTAVLMIQFMNNWDYPIIVGGKPPGAFPPMVPIMFELTILLTGFGTLFGLLHLAQLPRHHHPIFESEQFAAATDDKFFISVEATDSLFDLHKTRDLLSGLGPSHLELVEVPA